MTLDREAARALFGVDPTPAAAGVGAPYAAATPRAAAAQASPFATNSAFERMNGRTERKGVDWRLVAPVGIAVVCIGAIALFAIPRGDQAIEGKTVASTEVVAPPPAPTPAPMETAAVAPPPVMTPEPAPAPIVQRAATPRPAVTRRAPARTVAAAPSAGDSAANVSATEPAAPPPPTLGAPAAVDLTPSMPAAPPPIIEPAPEPQL